VCPVGATDEWFDAGSAALQREPGPRLRLIFVGLYTPLHGTPALAEALGRLADDDRVEITMVGDGQDRAAAERLAADNAHVTWLDWVSSAELPGLVSGHDVTLGIFGTTSKALEVVPTKVYQGAAAATAVVTSDTAPQRDALGDAAVLVPPGDAAALADAVRRLADDPALVARLRRAAYERARERFTAAAVVAPALESLAALDNTPRQDG
jgi:glycosyltransferase involved in cell wall biosynthesis